MAVILRQLEQFLAVADTGSFSRAALRAHVSQPALSTAIAKLEGDLGVQLFNRQARQVTLTAEGHRLRASAKLIVGECEAVRAALKKTTEHEVLSIGVSETLDLSALAASLEQFRRGHGAVRLKVRELDGPALLARLGAGTLNLAYLVLTGGEDIPEGVQTRLLSTESYVIATAMDHPLAGRKSAPLAVLHDLPFIARSHCEYRTVMTRLWADGRIRPKVVYSTSQDRRALDLVRAGLGAGIFPRSLVASDLHALEIEDHVAERHILCGWRPSMASAALRAFLAFNQIEDAR
jgi:DNA-binding transcriptional LysR family regulator